jgi:hydroxymethylbilane synthase
VIEPHPEQHHRVSTSPQSPWRLGTRVSRLALWQARHCADRLARVQVPTQVVELSTEGDRRATLPIESFATSAPFAADIEQALLTGEIDIAVHSLKDLDATPHPALVIAAVLPRADARDGLVTRDGLTLETLPSGAVVGTSSVRRAAQLRTSRPDLEFKPIRGHVESRVRQVREGAFDATVLALAGLARIHLESAFAQIFDPHEVLPAPGQGALAIQVRRADRVLAERVAVLDDEATRLAVTAELAFLQAFETIPDLVCAAYATCNASNITLHTRLLTPTGEHIWDDVATRTLSSSGDAAVKRAIPTRREETVTRRDTEPSCMPAATRQAVSFAEQFAYHTAQRARSASASQSAVPECQR